MDELFNDELLWIDSWSQELQNRILDIGDAMAWNTALPVLQDVFGNVNGQLRKARTVIASLSADSEIGPVTTVRFAELSTRLSTLAAVISTANGIAQFPQYVRDQFGQQGFNATTELLAVTSAASALATEVSALTAITPTVSTAQSATFRTLAADYLLAVT